MSSLSLFLVSRTSLHISVQMQKLQCCLLCEKNSAVTECVAQNTDSDTDFSRSVQLC